MRKTVRGRWTRSTTLALTAVVLLALAPADVSQSAPATCGVWRWPVKTLSDADANQVSFVPLARTISQLRTLHPPDDLGKTAPRLGRHELRVYRIRARLIEYKRESDRDFHVVVEQVNRPGRTMVVEVVDPTCPGATDSPRVGALSAVRQEFVATYGQPTGSFKPVPGSPVAFVIGVGFWDLCTGSHKPRGAAPNCIELHPVLDIEPVSGAMGGASRGDAEPPPSVDLPSSLPDFPVRARLPIRLSDIAQGAQVLGVIGGLIALVFAGRQVRGLAITRSADLLYRVSEKLQELDPPIVELAQALHAGRYPDVTDLGNPLTTAFRRVGNFFDFVAMLMVRGVLTKELQEAGLTKSILARFYRNYEAQIQLLREVEPQVFEHLERIAEQHARSAARLRGPGR